MDSTRLLAISHFLKQAKLITIKSRLQGNTTRAISLLACETHVETRTLNKTEEYMQENETCYRLGSELLLAKLNCKLCQHQV